MSEALPHSKVLKGCAPAEKHTAFDLQTFIPARFAPSATSRGASLLETLPCNGRMAGGSEQGALADVRSGAASYGKDFF